MRPTVVVFWLSLGAGFILAALAALAGAGQLTWLAFLLGFLPVFLAGWVVSRLQAGRRGQDREPPRDGRPADGIVGLLRVVGVVGEPNSSDPRFVRFVRFEPGFPAPPARGRPRPILLGRVALVSLFVGRDGRGWSDPEIAQAHKALKQAGEWIEGEARRWGVALNIDLADVDFVADDEVVEEVEIAFQPEGDESGPFEAHGLERAVASASRAAARLGFADVVDLIERVGPCINSDLCVWLLHLRRAGRSLAASERESGLSGVNLAICYAREVSFPEPLGGSPFPDPVTFVHELLHLFGARDKYGVSLASFPPKSVTARDVMVLAQRGLSRLRVDPLTAAEIGWVVPK